MKKYWLEQSDKAKAEAKAEHKLYVNGYDATCDGDFVAVMTPREFYKEKATIDSQYRAMNWLTVLEDFTAA